MRALAGTGRGMQRRRYSIPALHRVGRERLYDGTEGECVALSFPVHRAMGASQECVLGFIAQPTGLLRAMLGGFMSHAVPHASAMNCVLRMKCDRSTSPLQCSSSLRVVAAYVDIASCQ